MQDHPHGQLRLSLLNFSLIFPDAYRSERDVEPKLSYQLITFPDTDFSVFKPGHMDKIDAFIVADHNIIEFLYDPPDETAKKISTYVASLVEDESTIQMGIGTIPNSITAVLQDKKDLGVHSEVFSDGIVDLVENGVITGKKKTIHQGKIICSFVMGSRKLYDFVDNNPLIEFHSC